MTTAISSTTRTLIDELLAAERERPAVEKFSRWHELRPVSPPDRRYRHLLPLSAAGDGEQYSFEVNLDACTGCKACVTACHSLNGLEEEESWRRVGQLVSRRPGQDLPGIQHVTTACHHCVDPACLNGCPVLAYEKDAATGIVRHLDDQCIGCQYCVMMCPYEVPRYSPRLGIVRKCDMCHGRLAAGEAPACVQACPNEAIRIRTVSQVEVAAAYLPPKARETKFEIHNLFLPASPRPELTLPTTRYLTTCDLTSGLVAADEAQSAPANPHHPLALTLLLTQAAAGGFVTAALLRAAGTSVPAALTTVSLALLLAGLGVSALHLGQPFRAWRAFLGWRRSWLSREILAFGAFAGLAALTAAAAWSAGLAPWKGWLGGLTAVVAAAAVGASAMVYVATRRHAWSAARTFSAFGGTAAVTGPALAIASGKEASGLLVVAAGLAFALKLAAERAIVPRTRGAAWTPLRRTAELLAGPLRRRWLTQMALGTAGLASLGAASLGTGWVDFAGVTGAGLMLASEWCGRNLFFTSVSPERMPGGLAE